ncbi:MAG: RDD family protein [Phycisphaeraceae bacterium]|nr:RDD family protein [Phycisphaerales bacterium]MCB9860527.1 RDD family protein [Phycisphaeraceae bacterium]
MCARVSIAVLVVWCAACTRAQVLVASSPPSAELTDAAETHGWIVMPVGDIDPLASIGQEPRRIGVFHLPPREKIRAAKNRTMENEPGRAELVMRLSEMPTWIAARERMFYFVFSDRIAIDDQPTWRHAVMSLHVLPMPYGNSWGRSEPGRLDAMPAIPDHGEIIGFAATEMGLSVLMRSQPAEDGSSGVGVAYTFMVLKDAQWTERDLPNGFQIPTGTDCVLLVGQQGPMIGYATSEHAVWWAWEQLPGYGEQSSDWTLKQAPLGAATSTAISMISLQGEPAIVSVEQTEGNDSEYVLHTWMGDAFQRAGSVQDVPADAKAFSLDGNASVVLAWDRREQDSSLDHMPTVVELQVSGNAVIELFRGVLNLRGPIAKWELQVATLMLVMLTIGSLLIALQPEPKRNRTHLPAHRIRASRSQRLLAGMLDVVFVSALVEFIQYFLQQLDFALVDDGGVLWASLSHLMLVAVIGFLYSTLTEFAFGRTLGKSMTTCEVVQLVVEEASPPQKPTFMQAAARNGVRWLCPPVAMWGLLTARARHQGDMIAQTEVVSMIDRLGAEAPDPDRRQNNQSDEA